MPKLLRSTGPNKVSCIISWGGGHCSLKNAVSEYEAMRITHLEFSIYNFSPYDMS